MDSKKTKHIITIIFLTGILLCSYLFMGCYQDPEWSDNYLFIKHRPSTQFFFYTYMGESELPDSSEEGIAYQEFVIKNGGGMRSIYLPPYLIWAGWLIVATILFAIFRLILKVRKRE